MINPELEQQREQQIAAEWQSELESLDPRSHAYRETHQILEALIAESGITFPESEPIPSEKELPRGFIKQELLSVPTDIDGDQFWGSVRSLANKDYKVPTVELITDANRTVRVCDLRRETRTSLKGALPQNEVEQRRADLAFYRDLKNFADTGVPQNRVHGVPGIFYSKVGRTKIRAYWKPVDLKANSGISTVVRIGDCGNNVNFEEDLYRRLFGIQTSM